MGDTGYFDGYGYFWLTGRIHSTIFRGEQIYHPQLIEQYCLNCEKRATKAAALAIPDAELGQKLAVVLQVIRKEANLTEHITEKLAEISVTADKIVLTTKPFPMDPRHRRRRDCFSGGQFRAIRACRTGRGTFLKCQILSKI